MSQKLIFGIYCFLGYITNEYPRVVRPDVRSRGFSASRWTTGGTNPPLRGWSPEPPLFGLWVSRGFLRPSPPGYETSPSSSPISSSPLKRVNTFLGGSSRAPYM